ncbi:hypothetical protein C1T31_07185 [Hanstruepera neustonica]|uniref:Nucleotidyltransferase family protein n=1 Tax=Hanstruepera neustonica TaxID=1445657 RepID=A0A2K1DZ42_9FLAO|nr:nucleotidyltransferase family protein [Hanstruepera neustonica]PNQ73296.1 hypothetical protein C1T31_07185 [Hanstruepera neustonica]
MASLHQTFTHIANIISYKSDQIKLCNDIKNNLIDWDDVVKVASDHLVLTTVFCRLQEKSLLNLIPNDLKQYLEEITAINRNRNLDLLEDIKSVSSLLSKAHINHVFLKGSALLVSDYFEDLGERMIGDIDILVDANQITLAKINLIEHGYKKIPLRLSDKYQKKRHIPRLVNNEKLAALEIHSQLLRVGHTHKLEALKVLQNKRNMNGVFVPSSKDLMAHNILDFQINDRGNYYNSIHLKHIFDGLVIAKKDKLLRIDTIPDYRKYFLFSSIYFLDFDSVNKTIWDKILHGFFLLRLKQKPLNNIWCFLIKKIVYLKVLFKRGILFLTNSDYRKDIIKVIKPKP